MVIKNLHLHVPTDPFITDGDVTLIVASTLLSVLTLSWCWVVVSGALGVAVGGDEERLDGWT